jgi:hypothetical protein
MLYSNFQDRGRSTIFLFDHTGRECDPSCNIGIQFMAKDKISRKQASSSVAITLSEKQLHVALAPTSSGYCQFSKSC